MAAGARGVDVEIEAESPGPAFDRVFSVSLRTRPPVELAVARSRRPLHWGMGSGVPVLADRRDVFAVAVRLVHDRAFGRLADVDSRDRRLAAGAMLRLYEQLRALALHAAATCDPEARRAAMPFSPGVRFRVYSLLLGDRTGHIAQLTTACPGAMVFALALLEQEAQGLRDAGNRLLADVVAGRRLSPALDDAIAVWAEPGPRVDRDGIRSFTLKDRSPWTRLEQATSAERNRIRLEQRLLVRRASPRVGPADLFLPPPLAFSPDDIPRTPRANARWFRVMKNTATLWLDPARPDLGVGLSRFASRNAAQLHRRLAAEDPQAWWVALGWLSDFVSETRSPPSRSADPIALVDRSERWMARRLVAEEEARRAALPVRPVGGGGDARGRAALRPS